VREIAAVPNIGYLTCSNDEQIKLWSRDLDHLATFLGHSGFIFSCKPILIMGTQYYVSASDDNTVKVWKGVGELV
jgi:phospholipase A-2-activating protein